MKAEKTHSYPAWFYGPNGAHQIFHSDSEVPDGWHDHPSKVITAAKTGSEPLPPTTDKVPAAQRGAAPVVAGNAASTASRGAGPTEGQTDDVSNTLDRDGHPWDATLHAATKSLTKDGLWRMRVGVSRPAPKPGYPKPLLDL